MQEITNITDIVIHLATSKATQGEHTRLAVAQNIIDRLFVSNCITVAEMTNIIKNELIKEMKVK